MRNELQRIIDQLRQSDDLAVMQLGQLSPRYGIRFARLVQLNCVGFSSDFFAVPLPRCVVVNPPYPAAYRILIYATH
jgi:hypothetical protein